MLLDVEVALEDAQLTLLELLFAGSLLLSHAPGLEGHIGLRPSLLLALSLDELEKAILIFDLDLFDPSDRETLVLKFSPIAGRTGTPALANQEVAVTGAQSGFQKIREGHASLVL